MKLLQSMLIISLVGFFLVPASGEELSQEEREVLGKVLNQYFKISDALSDYIVERADDTASADKDPRENAFSSVAQVWVGIRMGQVAFIGGGIAVGTAIGISEGSVAAIPGMAIGGTLGGAIGGAVGLGAAGVLQIAGAIAEAHLSERIEQKYPHSGQKLTKASNRYAGEFESLNVHLIALSFPGDTRKIVDPKRIPGLTAKQRKAVERYLSKIDYIRKNRKISRNALPAIPIEQLVTLRNFSKFLAAASPAVEKAWLISLGLDRFTIKVDKGKFTMSTPQSLQNLGAPKTVETKLARVDANFKVFAASFQPGPFAIAGSSTSIATTGKHKGKIKLTYTIPKGARLGTAEAVFINPVSKKRTIMFRFSPTLKTVFRSTIYWRIEKGLLLIDKIELGQLDVDLHLPRKLSAAAARNKADFAQFRSRVEQTLKSLLQKLGGLPTRLFTPYQRYSLQSLARELGRKKKQYKLSLVENLQVHSMRIRSNKLELEIRGIEYRGPRIGELDHLLRQVTQQNDFIAAELKIESKKAIESALKAKLHNVPIGHFHIHSFFATPKKVTIAFKVGVYPDFGKVKAVVWSKTVTLQPNRKTSLIVVGTKPFLNSVYNLRAFKNAYVIAKIDPGNSVKESDERNNTAVFRLR